MSVRGTMLGAALLFAPVAAPAQQGAQPAASGIPARWREATPQRPLIVAHRGCWSVAPENSLSAIAACHALGVEAVENDVRLSHDGVAFVIHDRTLDRTTDGTGQVHELTAAQIGAMRLRERKGGPDAFVTRETLPTLDAYLREAKRLDIMVNLEIKTDPVHDARTVFEAAVNVVRAVDALDLVFFKIPDAPVAKGASARIIDTLDLRGLPLVMPIIWQDARPLSERLRGYAQYRAAGYEIVFTDPAFLERDAADPALKGKQIMVVAAGPQWSGGLDDRLALRDPDAAWGRALRAGATIIMTDRPEALVKWLRQTGRR